MGRLSCTDSSESAASGRAEVKDACQDKLWFFAGPSLRSISRSDEAMVSQGCLREDWHVGGGSGWRGTSVLMLFPSARHSFSGAAGLLMLCAAGGAACTVSSVFVADGAHPCTLSVLMVY